jgi:2,3-bisphosphoglycerate-independent phosphoglycerate mutase
MKSVIIVGDGMSDHPVAALDGKTPLQVANKPHIDRVAREGRTGLFTTVPEGMSKGSAVANLSVMGYDPRTCYQGRAVLEAASMGVTLSPDDVALRCNLICVEDGEIKNHSAGHIGTDEAAQLIKSLSRELTRDDDDRPLELHAGVGYRHLLVFRGDWASPDVVCAPPHDHVGEDAVDLLPRTSSDDPRAAAAVEKLIDLHTRARDVLRNHPVNQTRIAAGKDPANWIWTWSPGRRPMMDTLQKLYGVSGAVISAVDLVMGLGYYAGMEMIRVPGATGLEDTNYEGKAYACLDALADADLVYLHVEATDEAGHARDLEQKIRCIEHLDQRLVRIVLDGIEKRGDEVCLAVLPDHPTPVETGAHASDPVPVAIMRPGWTPDPVQGYDEQQVISGALGMLEGAEFIRTVLGV